MKYSMYLRYFSIAFAIAMILANIDPVAAQQKSKLHVLAICDEMNFPAGSARECISRDREAMHLFFASQVPVQDLSFKSLGAGQVISPSTITIAIDRMNIGPNDAFVCFYSGHGAYNQNSGYFFQLSGQGDMLRQTLISRLKAKGARLTVLISDCCAALANPQAVPTAGEPGVAPPSKWSPLCKRLMKETSGFVDIHSATPPESSYTRNKGDGSIFTVEFCAIGNNYRNRPLSWKDMYELTKSNSLKVAREMYGRVQTAQLLAYDVNGDPNGNSNGPRFGAGAVNHGGRGVKVTKVFSGLPAEKSGLETGDIILQIGDRPIRSVDDYSRAIDASRGTVNMQVINVRDGQVYTIEVNFNGN